MIIEHPTMADIPTLRRLWKAAFSDTDAFLDLFFSLAFSPERALIVREEGEARAMLYFLDCADFSYVYAVATEEKCRGKGYCRALMEKLHQERKRTVLVPVNENLRAFYERFGYRSFGGITESMCSADDTYVKAEELTIESYMQKRKALLPKGGLRQEGDFAPLLKQMLSFYGGDGWLMALAEEDGKYIALEFLGDKSVLPGILHTLQLESACVRCPGNAPFAMCRSEDGDDFLPTYFAFALD